MLKQLSFAFAIVSICLVIHAVGMVVIADRMSLRREAFARRPTLTHFAVLLGVVFAIVIVLHLVAGALWAVFFSYRGLFPDFETSLYFSLKSYSTIGYGDLLLPQRWRLLGCIEGITGALLCGLSTAFIFVIVNALFQIRVQQQNKQ